MPHYFLSTFFHTSSFRFLPAPHGKAKTKVAQSRPHVRTNPRVMQQIKDNDGLSPKKIYRKITMDPSIPAQNQRTATPKNRRQIWNCLYRKRHQFRLTHDGVFNTFYVAQHLDDFVRRIVVFPKEANMLVCLFKEDMASTLNDLLSISKSKTLLAYDTTFGLGSHWVSVLSARLTMFSGNPLVPVAFLIHERKYKRDHEYFLKMVADMCPALKTSQFTIVTDREFRNLASIFPQAFHAHCWIHLRRNVKFFLKKHKELNETKYKNDVNDLLQCKSR